MKDLVYDVPAGTLIASGKISGVPFWIINCYSHPCSYIDVSVLKDYTFIRSDNLDSYYSDNDVNCHGGCTFAEHRQTFLDPDNPGQTKTVEGDILGWDYAHTGDYCKFEQDLFLSGHKYTLQELCFEVAGVIVDLRERYEVRV